MGSTTRVFIRFVAAACIAALAPPAGADTVDQALAKIHLAIACTTAKACTDAEEVQKIHDAGQKVIDQDKDKKKPIKGHAGLNGVFPADGTFAVEVLAPGSLTLVSFEFLDPMTLLRTSGPLVAAVSYDYSDTPDIAASFTHLGTSSDAASDFSLAFAAFAAEQAIVATPLDAAGRPIFIADVDDIGNLAVGAAVDLVPDVPEPSTGVLLGAGLVALALARRFSGGAAWPASRESSAMIRG